MDDDAGNHDQRRNARGGYRKAAEDRRCSRCTVRSRAECRNEEHQWNDSEILEERNTEESPRERRAELVALGEEREHDCRRAERYQHSVEKPHPECAAQSHGQARHGQSREPHLHRSGKKRRAAERAQPCERHVKSDEEEDQCDPELRDGFDALGIPDESEGVWADDHAGEDVAENDGNLESPAEEQEGKRCEQDDRNVDHQRRIMHSLPPESSPQSLLCAARVSGMDPRGPECPHASFSLP